MAKRLVSDMNGSYSGFVVERVEPESRLTGSVLGEVKIRLEYIYCIWQISQ